MKEILIWSAVFLSAALHEILCVFWVHASERGQMFRAALYSSLCGTVGFFGLYFALDEFWRALVLIPGYGVGTGMAVWFKRRFM